jgi:hypothetical protein
MGAQGGPRKERLLLALIGRAKATAGPPPLVAWPPSPHGLVAAPDAPEEALLHRRGAAVSLHAGPDVLEEAELPGARLV